MATLTPRKLSRYTKTDLRKIIAEYYDMGMKAGDIGKILGVSGSVISYHYPKRKHLKRAAKLATKLTIVAKDDFKFCQKSYQRGYVAGVKRGRSERKGFWARLFGGK